MILNLNSQLNYYNYHQTIFRCEEEIINNNYQKALLIYDSLFSIYDKPFSKDIYNTALCSALSNDKIKLKKYLLRLSETGVRSIHVFRHKIFRKPFNKIEILKLIYEYNRNRNKKMNILKKQEENIFLKNLEIKDQKFRNKRGSYKIYADTIKKNDSLNVIDLKKYIYSKGYPNEYITSLEYPNELISPWVILRHYYTQEIKNDTLLNYLENEVKIGNLHIYSLCGFKEQQYHLNIKNYKTLEITSYINYNGLTYEFNINQEFKNKIDKLRKENGLENLDQYKKKLIYLKNKKNNPFIFYTHWGILNIQNGKDIIKNLIPINE